MEANQMTTRAILKNLYALPKLIRKTKRELKEIDRLTVRYLPRGNDLPQSARDLYKLLDQLRELIPNRFMIWLRFKYRPQKSFNKRVHRNHNEISKYYSDYFVRFGNGDIEMVRQNKEAGDLYLEIEEHVDIARGNIDYLLGTSELVHELSERFGAHKSYVGERGFKVISAVICTLLGIAVTLATQAITRL